MHMRHYGQARDTYLRVVRKFAALPAAETALFAAARVEAEHGQPLQAQALFRRYLERYPRGNFVREAQRRLQPEPEPTPTVERGR
jgi:TolA-binding protein